VAMGHLAGRKLILRRVWSLNVDIGFGKILNATGIGGRHTGNCGLKER